MTALRSLGWILLLLGASCRYETSFKTVEFQGAPRNSVFEICQEQLARYYQGIHIRADADAGRIETDPKEFTTDKGVRREQVFVAVDERDGRVEVALFAPMAKRVIDLDSEYPVQWETLGSDVKQERLLLEEIAGAVLAAHAEAQVIE